MEKQFRTIPDETQTWKIESVRRRVRSSLRGFDIAQPTVGSGLWAAAQRHYRGIGVDTELIVSPDLPGVGPVNPRIALILQCKQIVLEAEQSSPDLNRSEVVAS